MQHAHHRVCDEWCSEGRLGDYRVARHQGGGDLPTKYSEREIPRADTNKYTASMQRKQVFLTGRSMHLLRRAKQLAAASGVVIAVIDDLAQLGDGIRQGLARLTHQQTQKQ